MKLLCILITLAIVNVAPIMTADYANSVYTTNKYIKEVFDRDPTILKTAISNIIDGDKTFETLNVMLAIPDKANYWFTIEHDDSFINNLPEHIAIADQEAVQQAISQVTDIPVPQLGPNENFENDSLAQLGEARRRITGEVTKNVLIEAINEGTPEFPNLDEICILIGLLRSMERPDTYIKTASVDPAGYECILTSQNGNTFQYRAHHGYIAAVRPVGGNRVGYVDVLSELLSPWFYFYSYRSTNQHS
ncbi:uncharacterized protein LOC126842389 isoform X4 [Adelges cooleyi]|uniref:uncharacterized protein LOC126842389 isoform X2 n=1 Tax=Adelges cooleyi TaxID=133065 RepID=UPI00217F6631|nr:uncharacterized protein LOC126842389 isoform X2 [Adelges cooleyi]XP_050435310.1 uncharacterized protein LOC126842389 isoform X3 [Adelges cooleyi]XP_050435311.1 uncharacterized protein LOC126842389 isoform X4 [Adelges cooleyi]